MSEDYTVCRCGAKFTKDAEGQRLYDQHQSWCGKQGATSLGAAGRKASKRRGGDEDEQSSR